MSITTPPKDFQIMFLDMNSFFASVEQQVRPELRGCPVGVTPYTEDSGCVIAASYEAKQQGVKIARVSEAKMICPTIKIVEARPALYMVYHKEIKRAIEHFTPYFKACSVDEFEIRLTPRDQSREAAEKLAGNIKRYIKESVGDYLRCSIGIGPSYFLAKLAGERKKPDGLTTLQLKYLKNFYSKIKLTDIPGINIKMEANLKILGINSPTDLYNFNLPDLTRTLKHWGRLWYFRLRGFEVDEMIIKNKTIGHSHVLPPEHRTKLGAEAVLTKLIHKAGYRIRKEGYQAGGVYVCIGFMGVSTFHQGKVFSPFCDDRTFYENAASILKNCPWRGRPINVAVSAFNLSKLGGDQISIFAEIEKRKAIARALDAINDEFGADTIYPASEYLAKESAPDRIPFGQPRYDIKHG
ncbi:MAG: DNA polymerase [Patescibacteria group bacterium]